MKNNYRFGLSKIGLVNLHGHQEDSVYVDRITELVGGIITPKGTVEINELSIDKPFFDVHGIFKTITYKEVVQMTKECDDKIWKERVKMFEEYDKENYVLDLDKNEIINRYQSEYIDNTKKHEIGIAW